MNFLSKNSICLIAATLMTGASAAYGHDKAVGHTPSKSSISRNINDVSFDTNFTMGSSELSAADQASLQGLIMRTGTDNIARIEIAAWSDQDFPKGETDLAKDDIDLAGRRLNAVRDYITSQASGVRVRTYNMAESSNWLARTFRTDQAELKSIFAKNASAPMARKDFNLIKSDGGPSKAVVVIAPYYVR
jgi:hypothetical protein